jgi:hypothetical protein
MRRKEIRIAAPGRRIEGRDISIIQAHGWPKSWRLAAFTEGSKLCHTRKKKGEGPLQVKTIQERLAINVAFWSEAPGLAEKGYVADFVRLKSVGEEPSFYALFADPETKEEIIIIDPDRSLAEPALVKDVHALEFLIKHTKEETVTLPLGGHDEKIHRMPRAVIGFRKPNPIFRWTLEVGGELLTGERNRPVSFDKLSDVFDEAYRLGAGRAVIDIPQILRDYIASRDRRVAMVEGALKDQKTKLAPLAKKHGFNYTLFYKVVARGDNRPEMRAVIAELAGESEDVLWPEFDWGV